MSISERIRPGIEAADLGDIKDMPIHARELRRMAEVKRLGDLLEEAPSPEALADAENDREELASQLEALLAAIENLMKVKGRHNTEIAFNALVTIATDIKIAQVGEIT